MECSVELAALEGIGRTKFGTSRCQVKVLKNLASLVSDGRAGEFVACGSDVNSEGDQTGAFAARTIPAPRALGPSLRSRSTTS